MPTRPKLPHDDTDDLGDLTGALLDGDQRNDVYESKDPTSARVLIVHDDHRARATLRDALELNGFVVDEADSGASVISRVDAGALLRHTEAAMYRAKRSSHRLAFYEAAMEGAPASICGSQAICTTPSITGNSCSTASQTYPPLLFSLH